MLVIGSACLYRRTKAAAKMPIAANVAMPRTSTTATLTKLTLARSIPKTTPPSSSYRTVCPCRQRDWGAHEHLQRTDHLLLPHRRGGGPHDGGEQSEERHTQDDEGEVVAPVGDQVR